MKKMTYMNDFKFNIGSLYELTEDELYFTTPQYDMVLFRRNQGYLMYLGTRIETRERGGRTRVTTTETYYQFLSPQGTILERVLVNKYRSVPLLREVETSS